MQWQERRSDDEVDGSELVRGVIIALLLAIPLWALIGIALILAFQGSPITRGESAALMLAAAAEAILLRYAWRAYRPRLPFRDWLADVVFARPTGQALKQAAFLGALAVAYLHYYFWDVQLQIASLNRVTVFI
jgi:hypothetical protein